MACLRVKFPDKDEPTALILSGARITLGRLPLNTIQIVDRTISGFHAELVLEGDHYRLHDRGSTNGTFVNGEQATDFHLREDCVVKFGSVEGVFSLETPSEEEAPEPLPSRGEVNAVRQENAELKSQLEVLREELETARKLRAADSAGETITVASEEFAKVSSERETLKQAQQRQEQEVARLKGELAVLQQDRKNLQLAADAAQATVAKLKRAAAEADAGAKSSNALPTSSGEPAAEDSVAPGTTLEALAENPMAAEPGVKEEAAAPPSPAAVEAPAQAAPEPVRDVSEDTGEAPFSPAPLPPPRVPISAVKQVPPPAPPIARPSPPTLPSVPKPPGKLPSMPLRPAAPGSGLRPIARPAQPGSGSGIKPALPGQGMPAAPAGSGIRPSAPGAPGLPKPGALPPVRPPAATTPGLLDPNKPIFQRVPQATAKPAAPSTEKIDISQLPSGKPSAPGLKPPIKLPQQPPLPRAEPAEEE